MNTTIDFIMTAYRSLAIPELPGSFAADVLRAIRLRKSEPAIAVNWWQEFLETILRPSFLVAGVSVAIAVGAFVPYTTHSAETALAARGLDLAVFDGNSQLLPSGRLGHVGTN